MIEVRVPDEQEGTKAVVRAWLKRVGEPVAINDPLVELETDKVTQEVPSPGAGVLAEIILETDAEAVPGALLARIAIGGDAPSEDRSNQGNRAKSATAVAERGPVQPGTSDTGTVAGRETRLSPSVRRACLQHGIDPARIEGTGRNGRVTREDVDRAVS
ncbi:MAG TPA: biotin/lipoyl-containing protein, partial [Sphingomicrobium sp.]|nr:biotin/lipoyl-containing protein [Sphingomicrobium sp.]